MRSIELKYGEGCLTFDLPEENILQMLHSAEIEPVTNLEMAVNNCLDHPIDSKPFDEIFYAGDKVTIVVSDITRIWNKQDQYLPFVVERLNKLGIKDEDIIILVATGTHREGTSEEKTRLVGEDLYGRLQVIDHNCVTSEMVYVGTTPRETEVEVNKLVVERKTILIGGIVHHLMAGFGGGRKSIIPGVASGKTVAQNHLNALDPNAERSNPLIGVGVKDVNPLQLDMVDGARLVNPDFLINSIVDTKGNLAKLVAGHWLSAWEAGCEWAHEKFGVPIEEKADIVIAGCGGFPKDISLYQGVKALFNAALGVKPGGTILMVAECREGAGAEAFFNWCKPLQEGKLDTELRKNFTIPGYIFYAAVESAQNAQVILLSSIEPSIVEPMGFAAVNTLEEALEQADVNNPSKKVIIMPYGGSTVPIS